MDGYELYSWWELFNISFFRIIIAKRRDQEIEVKYSNRQQVGVAKPSQDCNANGSSTNNRLV